MKNTIRGKWLLLGSSAVLFFCIVSFPALAHRDGPETQGGSETRPLYTISTRTGIPVIIQEFATVRTVGRAEGYRPLPDHQITAFVAYHPPCTTSDR
jgi:hypothetical protein